MVSALAVLTEKAVESPAPTRQLQAVLGHSWPLQALRLCAQTKPTPIQNEKKKHFTHVLQQHSAVKRSRTAEGAARWETQTQNPTQHRPWRTEVDARALGTGAGTPLLLVRMVQGNCLQGLSFFIG